MRRLAELVTDAWRMRAPDALVAEVDEARPPQITRPDLAGG